MLDDSTPFKIVSNFKPTGDQPEAIKELVAGINDGARVQVLLGATGTGKTFTMANIIEKTQKPTIILEPNKTLAGQIYAEMQGLFPNNRVEYFVSNFDFYQPEAYLPASDTFIDKSALMNDEIEMLRTSAINSILERRDTIIVASVASIYGLTDPSEYIKLAFDVRVDEKLDRNVFLKRLIEAQYKKNNIDFAPGRFRVNGDVIDVFPIASRDTYIRISTFDDVIESIKRINFVDGEVLENFKTCPIYPAYDHASTFERVKSVCKGILKDLDERVAYFKKEGKLLEAERIEMRTKQDVENLEEFVKRTGIDSLAVAIGTAHSAFKYKPGEKPALRFDILEEIEQRLPNFPLVLHGSSSIPKERLALVNKYGGKMAAAIGIPEPMLREASKHAVCKINVGTDLRVCWTGEVRRFFAEHPEEFEIRKYTTPAKKAVTEMVADKMKNVFGSSGHAVIGE